ncbi:MAG: type II secretion system protein GspG [Candidatus Sumerlaeaceae bacterium]|nr:type II secretion system protein GspG [Candidatus Sumerlaeaceae bacterium]
MRRPSGFTLIELLIVVAIIAILAAIAVPNFLEAQTRAKVSRCKADMRSLATAIESYMVDHNRYPTDAGNGVSGIWRPYAGGNVLANPPANFTIGYELTTPVAYISSADIFIDTFKRDRLAFYKSSPTLQGREFFFFMNIPLRREKNGGVGFTAQEAWGGAWILWGAGPDRFTNNNTTGFSDFSNAVNIPRGIPYDPTNGTVSNGDIHRGQGNSEINLPRPGVVD